MNYNFFPFFPKSWQITWVARLLIVLTFNSRVIFFGGGVDLNKLAFVPRVKERKCPCNDSPWWEEYGGTNYDISKSFGMWLVEGKAKLADRIRAMFLKAKDYRIYGHHSFRAGFCHSCCLGGGGWDVNFRHHQWLLSLVKRSALPWLMSMERVLCRDLHCAYRTSTEEISMALRPRSPKPQWHSLLQHLFKLQDSISCDEQTSIEFSSQKIGLWFGNTIECDCTVIGSPYHQCSCHIP